MALLYQNGTRHRGIRRIYRRRFLFSPKPLAQTNCLHNISFSFIRSSEKPKSKLSDTISSQVKKPPMSEPKSDPSSISVSEKEVKAPNAFVRVKEEFEAVLHKTHHETHGKRPDLDEKTSMSEVKAPNVFERAKEEIEALVQTIHTKKESGGSDSCEEIRDSSSNSEKDAKRPGWIERSKKEMGDLVNKMKSPRSHHHHHRETHGMSEDIDSNTPISHVKGPNVFERAKEEIEAIVGAIHPKKDSGSAISSPKKEGRIEATIGRGLETICSPKLGKGLEKICSPGSHNKD